MPVPARSKAETGSATRVAWCAVAIAVSASGASFVAPGMSAAHAQTHAQAQAIGTAIGLAGPDLRMSPHARFQVQQALEAMESDELVLTYARIYVTFREFLGHDDLSIARALIDYATLTQVEMERRNLLRPEGTESASAMSIAYELVL